MFPDADGYLTVYFVNGAERTFPFANEGVAWSDGAGALEVSHAGKGDQRVREYFPWHTVTRFEVVCNSPGAVILSQAREITATHNFGTIEEE